jgi:hypothetical protein
MPAYNARGTATNPAGRLHARCSRTMDLSFLTIGARYTRPEPARR